MENFDYFDALKEVLSRPLTTQRVIKAVAVQ